MGLKEESVGFLFNVTVEAAPAPTVAPVAAPPGWPQFAAEAAARAARQGGVATKERPAGLRAKGIDDDAPPLTYTGPSEDGSAQVRGSGGGSPPRPAPAGGSDARREAARRQAARPGRRGD